MAEISKPLLNDLWSSEGARTIPNSSKIRVGWTSEIPPYQTQNWWQSRVDEALKHIFQKGVLAWDANEEYFKDKSIVNYQGKMYVALTNNTNKNPSSNPIDWKRTGLDYEDLPLASTSVLGIVKLEDSLANTSTTLALTANQGNVLDGKKVDKSSIEDGLNSNDNTRVLSAAQGKVLRDTKLNISDVLDSLISTSITSALSANKGRELSVGKVDKTTTVNGKPLSANISLDKGDIGLSNVDNIKQVPMSWVDIDGNLTSNSDSKIATQKAIKTYTDTKIGKVDIVNNLSSSSTTKVLSAAQGKALNDTKFNKSDVVNVLNSSDTTKALSAAKGKDLQDNKLNKSDVLDNINLGSDKTRPPSQDSVKKYVDNNMVEGTPVGLIAYWPVGSVPNGWLKCNGTSLDRTTYSSLFSVIGITYGSSSGSNFLLPDLRGRFVRTLDDGKGIDPGRTIGSTQTSANLQHNHGGTTATENRGHTHSGTTNSNGAHTHQLDYNVPRYVKTAYKNTDHHTLFSLNGPSVKPYTKESGNHTHTITTGDVSQTHTHAISNEGTSESRPNNIALMAIIKY